MNGRAPEVYLYGGRSFKTGCWVWFGTCAAGEGGWAQPNRESPGTTAAGGGHRGFYAPAAGNAGPASAMPRDG